MSGSAFCEKLYRDELLRLRDLHNVVKYRLKFIAGGVDK